MIRSRKHLRLPLHGVLAAVMTWTASSAGAGEAALPSIAPDWGKVTIHDTREGLRKEIRLDGKVIGHMAGEPHTADISGIKAAAADGALVVDAARFDDAKIKKLNTVLNLIPAKTFAPGTYSLSVDFEAPAGAKLDVYLEGSTPEKKHFYRSVSPVGDGARQTATLEVADLPKEMNELHVRVDFLSPHTFTIRGIRFGPKPDPVETALAPVDAELLFRLPFDGSARAAVAGGRADPVSAEGIEFLPGVSGQAVRLTKAARSVLRYATPGNLVPARGTVSAWVKMDPHERPESVFPGEWRSVLSMVLPEKRHGSGSVWFWLWNDYPRVDTSDVADSYRMANTVVPADRWTHLAYVWNEVDATLYIDGVERRVIGDGRSGVVPAKIREYRRPDGAPFDFFVGGSFAQGAGPDQQFDGLIDELRIYSAPLPAGEIAKLAAEFRPVRLDVSAARYLRPGEAKPFSVAAVNQGDRPLSAAWTLADAAGRVVARGKTPVLPAHGRADFAVAATASLAPGNHRLAVVADGHEHAETLRVLRPQNPYLAPDGVDALRVTPVETLRPDTGLPADRHVAIGQSRMGKLGERAYLEAGSGRGDRFALRFSLPDTDHAYRIEWDYPDDKKRTADVIIQSTRLHMGSNEYEVQVGYATGAEYRNTGTMQKGGALYWPRSRDIALVFMTAREGEPAAVAEIRIERVDGGLPDARIRNAPAADGVNRTVGMYYEDPNLNGSFGLNVRSMADAEVMLDRLAAYMKYSGQDFLAYPMVWYQGAIGEHYNPREHVDDFFGGLLTKFDLEGLAFMGTINRNNLVLPPGSVTQGKIDDGSLHASPVSILATGKPNPGRWHDSWPNFNPLHPDTTRALLADVDRMLDIGADHPSFKGVALHVARHSLLSLGDIESGYNDYMIEAFEKDTGIRVGVADRTDPLRGKAYAEWLLANAREAWIDWRCRAMAGVYRQLADRIAQRRGDLRLVVNSLLATCEYRDPRFLDPDFVRARNREAGLDPKYLADLPNTVLDQTLYPADHRFYSDRPNISPAALAKLDTLYADADTYFLPAGSPCPWTHMHDRYFESAIGSTQKEHWSDKPNALSAPWLSEQQWRVTTVNPGGFHALRHYVQPMRYLDLQGVTKGGFLVGTYGMEPYLVPFARALRSLPARKFDDVDSGSSVVKARRLEWNGATWFYVVNTGDQPATVRMEVVGGGQPVDTVTGAALASKGPLALAPYQLRTFTADGSATVTVRTEP